MVRAIFWLATSLPSTFSDAGTASADAAHAVEGQGCGAESVVLEVELQGVLAGRKRFRPLPADSLQIEEVPDEDRLAFQHVEAVAAEPTAVGTQHALGAALGYVDVCGDSVGGIEDAGRIARAGCPVNSPE